MTRDALDVDGGTDVDIGPPDRLALITQMDLSGHLRHPDLDAVVSTLVARCRVPIAVINIVTPDLQTYPAEIGVGALSTQDRIVA